MRSSTVARITATISFLVLLIGMVIAGTIPAKAASRPSTPQDGGTTGYYLSHLNDGKYQLFLGSLPVKYGKDRAYCVAAGVQEPTGKEATSVSSLTAPTTQAPAGLVVSTPQMAYLLGKYQDSNDQLTQAGLGYLLNINFQQSGANKSNAPWIPSATVQDSVNWIVDLVQKEGRVIDTKARQLAEEAAKSAAVGYQKGSYTGENKRRGVIKGIAVNNSAGEYRAGIPVQITLKGPAKFVATNSPVWKGKTASTPLTLEWVATGNGKVTYQAKFNSPHRRTLSLVDSGGNIQKTITISRRPPSDPSEISMPGGTWKVIYDFQPQGVSQVEKISDEGVFTDVFDAQADPKYGDGKWLELDADEASRYGLSAGSVPVTYKVSAYYTGVNPPATSKGVPEGAELIGSKQVVASGPGKISATFSAAKPGFATVVWEVVKNEQGKAAELIHQDWKDGYGLTQETTSYRHKLEIDSSLSIRQTKTGTYLVDDLFVEGMPDNHPSFDGLGRFDKDEAFIEQSLLFFPKGLEVSEANKDKAIQVGESVKIPAKNGFHASIGSTSFKLRYQENNLPEPGTYVFVSSFKGDDRVKPFQSLVTDEKEQYKVDETLPILVTTARDKTDGDKILRPIPGVSVEDKVCDINKTLIPGKKYSLLTDIVKKSDGKSVLDKPKESFFTIDKIGDCTSVELSFDGSKLKDEQVVVFQTLKNDKGETIAEHHNINDLDQTLRFGSGGGGEGLAKTGAGIGALLGASIGSIIAGNNLRRKK